MGCGCGGNRIVTRGKRYQLNQKNFDNQRKQSTKGKVNVELEQKGIDEKQNNNGEDV